MKLNVFFYRCYQLYFCMSGWIVVKFFSYLWNSMNFSHFLTQPNLNFYFWSNLERMIKNVNRPTIEIFNTSHQTRILNLCEIDIRNSNRNMFRWFSLSWGYDLEAICSTLILVVTYVLELCVSSYDDSNAPFSCRNILSIINILVYF